MSAAFRKGTGTGLGCGRPGRSRRVSLRGTQGKTAPIRDGGGWKAFEAIGVEPVFLKRQHAIDYAKCRASFRSGEIRLFDRVGNHEETIHFADSAFLACVPREISIRPFYTAGPKTGKS
jgi:hypothetical protein